MAIVFFYEDPAPKEDRRVPIEFRKEAFDIVAVVESYGVALDKRGVELVSLCPFHNETAPSFSLNPEKQVFYCHGCQAGGDVADFVAAWEGISRYDAALRLVGNSAIRYDLDVLQRVVSKASHPAVNHRDFYASVARMDDLMQGLWRDRQYFEIAFGHVVKRLRKKVSVDKLVELWDAALDLFGTDLYHRLIAWDLERCDFWTDRSDRVDMLSAREKRGELVSRREWDSIYAETRNKYRYLSGGG